MNCDITLSFEEVAPVPSLPGTLIKAQQGGVNSHAGAPLVHLVHVTGAHSGHQWNWNEDEMM